MSRPFDKLMFPLTDSMGDSFVTAAIVKHYARMCNQMYVPVAGWQIPTLQTLYTVDANVQVINHQQESTMIQIKSQPGLALIKAASIYVSPTPDGNSCVLWDEQWYTFFQLPFSLRYTGFTFSHKLPGSQKLFDSLVKQPNYILVHKEMGPYRTSLQIDLQSWRSQSGLPPLEDHQIIEINPNVSENMMDYIDLIRNAAEIHCVPSSFFCLVDSITSQTQARLFYHNIRQGTQMRVNNPYNQLRWCFINYSQKFSGI